MKAGKSRPYFFIDLFAGCGGASLGAETAGFESLGHVEIDPIARETLKINFGDSPFSALRKSNGNVQQINLKLLKKEIREIGIDSLDLLIACPPCQGFSAAGRAKINSLSQARGCFSKDPRNRLYKSIIKFIKIVKPKAILFENVPGMLNVKGVNFVEKFCSDLDGVGYNAKCSILNSAWYGVPQSRERVFVVAFRKDLRIDPEFPIALNCLENVGGAWGQPIKNGIRWSNPKFICKPTKIQKSKFIQSGVSVKQALCDLPSFTDHLKEGYYPSRSKCKIFNYLTKTPPNHYCNLMRNWPSYKSESVEDHFCRRTPRDYYLFRKMKPGDLFPQAHKIASQKWYKLKKLKQAGEINRLPKKSEVVPPYRLDCFPEKWQKLDPDRLACTLTAHLEKDGYSHIHYDSKQARTLTLREAARLQSFPDAYKFAGHMGHVFRQIGNAVPPLVAFSIAKTILSKLKNDSKRKHYRFSKQQEDKEQILEVT